jgi:hypothetical protein
VLLGLVAVSTASRRRDGRAGARAGEGEAPAPP